MRSPVDMDPGAPLPRGGGTCLLMTGGLLSPDPGEEVEAGEEWREEEEGSALLTLKPPPRGGRDLTVSPDTPPVGRDERL